LKAHYASCAPHGSAGRRRDKRARWCPSHPTVSPDRRRRSTGAAAEVGAIAQVDVLHLRYARHAAAVKAHHRVDRVGAEAVLELGRALR